MPCTLFPYTTLFRSGKSFAAKRELVNVFLATKDRIIVVDPMGEYSPLIKRLGGQVIEDRKSTRLNSSHVSISYAVFCLIKKTREDRHVSIDIGRGLI